MYDSIQITTVPKINVYLTYAANFLGFFFKFQGFAIENDSIYLVHIEAFYAVPDF